MLRLYRRHVQRCPNDTRDALKCHCPIWMDWTQDNNRVHKAMGMRDWQAAQIRAREMEAAGIEAYEAGKNSAITVEYAVEDFKKDLEKRVQDSTRKQYKILLDRLKAHCKQHHLVYLKQLGVVQVRDFRNSWTTYSPRTEGKHIERLKTFFTFCQDSGWIEKSPAKPLKSPKAGETDVIPFSEEEVQKILQTCDGYKGPNRDKLIVLTKLMLATGLAIGDASMLAKKKVRKEGTGWYVELRRAKTGTAVSCPISNGLAESFQKLDGETPFWSGKSDLEDLTKNWRKIYAKIFKTAGVKGHPHQFRHTTAKRMLVHGLSVAHVATLLGNTEEIVRKHYSKWIPERQKAFDNAVRAIWDLTSAT
jgi:site-specific recombinase XerD